MWQSRSVRLKGVPHANEIVPMPNNTHESVIRSKLLRTIDNRQMSVDAAKRHRPVRATMFDVMGWKKALMESAAMATRITLIAINSVRSYPIPTQAAITANVTKGTKLNAMEIVRKKPIALVALTSLLLLIGLMDGGLVGVFERGKN